MSDELVELNRTLIKVNVELRDEVEALRNKVATADSEWSRMRRDCEALIAERNQLLAELAEHKRTAAIVAGGMKRLADERDVLRDFILDLPALIAALREAWETIEELKDGKAQ